jgi:hypothetical protein
MTDASLSAAIFSSVIDETAPSFQSFICITSDSGSFGNLRWDNREKSFSLAKCWHTVQVLTGKHVCNLKAPYFSSLEDLCDYIKALFDAHHAYDTAIYATSLANEALINYISRVGGFSGLMVSCAATDIVRRVRNVTGGMAVVTSDNYLYPQYAYMHDQLKEEMEKSAARQAMDNLKAGTKASERVLIHWKNLAFKYHPSELRELYRATA